MTLFNTILFLLTSVSDRFRGHTDPIPHQAKRIIEAFLIVLCAGVIEPKAVALSTALLWTGICIGSYGNAIGPAISGKKPAKRKTKTNPGPEWWQFGPLLNNANASLIVVGAIWGLPVLAMQPLDSHVLAIPVVLMLAFPLSCWIARAIDDVLIFSKHEHIWALQQWIFGLIVASLLTAWRCLYA